MLSLKARWPTTHKNAKDDQRLADSLDTFLAKMRKNAKLSLFVRHDTLKAIRDKIYANAMNESN
jgi:hypothetical protein